LKWQQSEDPLRPGSLLRRRGRGNGPRRSCAEVMRSTWSTASSLSDPRSRSPSRSSARPSRATDAKPSHSNRRCRCSISTSTAVAKVSRWSGAVRSIRRRSSCASCLIARQRRYEVIGPATPDGGHGRCTNNQSIAAPSCAPRRLPAAQEYFAERLNGPSGAPLVEFPSSRNAPAGVPS
jgi:hypothetical protein